MNLRLSKMLRLDKLTSVLSFSPRGRVILNGPGMNQAKAASMRFELEVARERKYEFQPGVPATVSSK